MSTIESGTRSWQNLQLTVKLQQGNFSRSYTRDVGMTKLATGALVFSASGGTVTLAGTMGAFGYNDDVLVEGTVSNNGFYKVTTTSTNAIGLSPAPRDETAPATAFIRAA